MTDIPALIRANQARWATAEITPSKFSEVDAIARRILRYKTTYLLTEQETGVPWWVVAVIHEREASGAWWANIANGEPWNRTTRNVPRGRGPFTSWQSAAVDALTKAPPFAARWKDWTAGGTLTILEMYNGFGYENIHHEASPYIWAATNHEEWGKYVQDGQWNPRVWDQQLGCAAMLKRLCELDPSIQFSGGEAS